MSIKHLVKYNYCNSMWYTMQISIVDNNTRKENKTKSDLPIKNVANKAAFLRCCGNMLTDDDDDGDIDADVVSQNDFSFSNG